jgi:cytochrome c peroxidase
VHDVQLITADGETVAMAVGKAPSADRAIDAIASFERTLVSVDSPFDRSLRGLPMGSAETRGAAVFESVGCDSCHSGRFFTDAWRSVSSPDRRPTCRHTGLYNLAGGRYPPDNPGGFALTGKPDDVGKFRVPMLRNIWRIGPCMHGGSTGALEGVVDPYAAGGRTDNPHTDALWIGFEIDPQERADLGAFLKAL